MHIVGAQLTLVVESNPSNILNSMRDTDLGAWDGVKQREDEQKDDLFDDAVLQSHIATGARKVNKLARQKDKTEQAADGGDAQYVC